MASYDDEYARLEKQLSNLPSVMGQGMLATSTVNIRQDIESQMREQVRLRDEESKRIEAENKAWHENYQKTSSSSTSNGVVASSAPAPPPAPVLPIFKPMTANSKNFKVAPSDIIQFDESNVEIALITDLLFEDIGAVELSNISRADLIDGQDVIYAPIKNLPTIRQDFNPNNLIATAASNDYFSRFGLDLFNKGIHTPYFDDSGNLVIEVDSIGSDEEIQVQILTNGTIDLVDEA